MIESAFFDPLVIHVEKQEVLIFRPILHKGLKEADFDLQQKALIKATNLIADHLSGSHSQVKTIEAKKFTPRKKF